VARLSITAGSVSDTGRVRQLNEDFAATLRIEEDGDAYSGPRYLAVIADGMGGHAAGEVASRMAVDTFLGIVQKEEDRAADNPSGESYVVRAIRAANDAVYTQSQEAETTHGMGTTLTGVVVLDDELHIGHVGDTRAYLLRGATIRQLTEDDSWVAEQVQRGIMTEEEAQSSERRNILNRALGTKASVPIHTYQEHLEEGDVVVLTTDGLHNSVSAPEIGDVVRASRSVQEACEHLVQLARERDGSDNISVICLAFGRDARSAPTDHLPRIGDTSQRARRLRVLLLVVLLAAAAVIAYCLRPVSFRAPPAHGSPTAALRASPAGQTSGDTRHNSVDTFAPQAEGPGPADTRTTQ